MCDICSCLYFHNSGLLVRVSPNIWTWSYPISSTSPARSTPEDDESEEKELRVVCGCFSLWKSGAYMQLLIVCSKKKCFWLEIISPKDWFFDTPRKIKESNVKMMVWKMIFLFQGCILRFHVNLPGCTGDKKEPPQDPGFLFPFRRYEFTIKKQQTAPSTGEDGWSFRLQ